MTEKCVKFFVRIFPREKTKTDAVNIILREKEVKLVVSESAGRYQYRTFQTDGVFTDHCQSDIFKQVIDEPEFEDVTRGTCLVVVALGAPISGKTYTLMGIKDSYQFRGLIPRFLRKVFSHARASTYKISISFIQFVNEKCTDLLSGNVHKAEFYKGIMPIEVKSETEALDLLFTGEKKRSRKGGFSCGSGVFSIFINIPATVIKRSSVTEIHLVDAAGMWNPSQTEACISPLKNLYAWKWPFTLRKAVLDHIDKQDASYKLVPMIGFLREAISNGRLRLIAHVKDDVENRRYNKWTLSFCNELCGRGRWTAENLTDTPYLMRTKDLLNEIQELEDQRDYGQKANDIVFIPYRAEDATNDYSEVIKSFFNDDKTENDLMTVAHPTILLQAMKKFYTSAFDASQRDASTTRSKKSLRLPDYEQRRSPSIQSRKKFSVIQPAKGSERITREPSSDPQENWMIFWSEFLDRYPEKRRELSVAIEEMKLARLEKALKQKALTSVKNKAIESENEAKRTLWKRSLKGGSDIAPRSKTRDVQLEEEKEIISSGKKFDDQVWEAQNDFALAHKNYLKKLKIFNNIASGMDSLFMDYILTTYDCNLALPKVLNFEERVPPDRNESQLFPVEQDLEKEAYDYLKQYHLFKRAYTPLSDVKHLFKYSKILNEL